MPSRVLLTVVVVSLGYFVDILDLTLFGMVRVASMHDLGFGDDLGKGMALLNAQMFGMLCGGLLWGKLGDIKGRMSTMFYSIMLYSAANLLNAAVQNYEQYLALRFLSGIGLAGELGVGITLVSEILPKEKRGLGTTMVATIGVLGAVLGGVMVEYCSWRMCYLIGGSLGLALLTLRFSLRESVLFEQQSAQSTVTRGRLWMLVNSRERFLRYLSVIALGMPIWFIAGIVMILTPETAKELGVTDPISAARSISISYLGLAVGDFCSGFSSQLLKSRKRAVLLFQSLACAFVILLFATAGGRSATYFYGVCFLIGVGAGYWALFVTIAAENFGTNLRATAATSIPNFVRASVIPMNALVLYLHGHYSWSLWQSSLITGAMVFAASLVACYGMRETFTIDLDYQEG